MAVVAVEASARTGALDAMRRRLTESKEAFAEVFRHADLRNLQIALALNWTGENAYLVALAIYAFDQGGSIAVGLLGLGRLLPAGVMALFGSAVADRYRRERVLRMLLLFRTVAAAASAMALFGNAPAIVVLVLGGSVTVASAALRPAYWALLPSLARTPQQLCASNVSSSTSEGASLLAGPAIGGVLFATSGAGWVFALGAVTFLVAAGFATAIRAGGIAEQRRERRGVVREAAQGVRAVVSNRDTALLYGLAAGQTFVRGALNVLIVVAAFQLLRIGEAGVGFLNTAFGVGNFVGALAALTLVGRRRFAGPVAGGLMLWGLPIALVAAWTNPAFALVLLALPGWGNAIFDISVLTMVQRTTADEVLGRVFGVLETTVFASMALGSIAASGLIAGLGIRGALVVTGAVPPVLVALAMRRLRGIDDRSDVPEKEIALLRRVSIFAPLPAVALEHLAAKVVSMCAQPGSRIVRQGDTGDRFYVVAEGEVEVRHGRRATARLGPGDCFGEIALVRGVPRTATVEARGEVELLTLDRDDFLAALSRHEQAACVSEQIVGERQPPPASEKRRPPRPTIRAPRATH